MSTQKGVGVVWGIVSAISGDGIGTGVIQSVEYEKTANMEAIVGADGIVVSEVYSGPQEKLNVVIVPSGATMAAAKTANIIPEIGGIITVATGAVGDAGEIQMQGAYTCDSAKKSRTMNGVATITVSMHRNAGGNLATIAT